MAIDDKENKKALETLTKINAIYRTMGKKKLELIDSNISELPNILGSARTELENMDGTASSLYGQLRAMTSEMKGQATSIGLARKGYRDLTKAASTLASDEKEIAQLGSKGLKTLLDKAIASKSLMKSGAEELARSNEAVKLIEEEVKLLKDSNDSIENQNAYRTQQILQSKALNEEEKAILLSHHDQNSIADQIIKKTETRLALEKKIEKKASSFSTLSSIVKSIPGLSGLSAPFEAAAEAAKDTARESKSGLKIFAAGGKVLLNAFGPITLLVTAFKVFKDIAFAVDGTQTSIAKSMSLSASEAKAQYETVKDIKNDSDDIFVSTKNLVKAQGDLGKAFGVTRGFTAQQLEDQVSLVDKMGVQEETAGRLQALAMTSGTTANQALDSVIAETQALKLKTGIQLDQKGVLDEVAKTDGRLAANYKNNPGMIAKAVLQTRKLGLSLAQAAKMASNMLDFESSIGKEMEAEVLLGRDLNFDKARALALSGDAAGAAAEIRKQTGSLADFQKLNVIQQEALATAAGMTSDELANSLLTEENMSKLGANTRKEIQERVKLLKSQGKVEEANRLLSQTGNAADAKAALERVTIQQEFQQALDVAKETFAEIFDETFDIAGTAKSIVGFFSSLAKNMGAIKTMAIVLGTVFGAMAISSTITAVAAMTTASAVTLGIGALAIAGGLALMAGVFDSSVESATKGTEQKINDGLIGPGGETIVSGPKGSIQLNKQDSMIVGTNLGGGGNGGGSSSNALIARIDKLISIVEKGGNVYLDGSKVGEALVLSSNLSS
tara:strand:- start:15872 stop:18229 length:2358 start_codon:yes stop_codon:yes gene_type:complete